jgi:O-antigen/teichoic acid export membrane protein
VVYHDEGPLSLAAFDRHQARKLLSYGGWISVSGIISPILTSLDQFVIGSVLNVAAVTHYAVPMNLVTRSQVFAGALSRTLFPRMSSVSPEQAHSLASRALISLAYGYGAICAPAIILTPMFFKYWISPDFAAVAAPVAQTLFFGAWINGLAFVPYGLLQSQGRPDVTGKFHAAEVLPFIGILWGLTSAYGITGAALAWSLRCAADAACLFWAAGMPRHALLKALALPLLLLSGSKILALYVGPNLWVSLAAATVVGFIGISLAFFISKDFRDAIFSLILRATGTLMSDRPRSTLTGKPETSK